MSHHAIALRGRTDIANGLAPLLVARQDEDFIGALLADLGGAWPAGGWPAAVAETRVAGDSANPPTLFQPVHRSFNLVLADAACLRFGAPRIDPKKILSAGLVVRRYVGPKTGAAGLDDWRYWERWVKAGKRTLGWRRFRSEAEYRADPDAGKRGTPRAGHPQIDRLLAERFALAPEDESSAPLFVAPPDICAAAKRTVLYGYVPTGSESADSPEVPPYARLASNDADAQEVRQRLVNHLHPALTGTAPMVLPRPLQRFALDWLEPANLSADAALSGFAALMRQLTSEFDAFGTSRESRRLTEALGRLRAQWDWPYPYGMREGSAAPWLARCADVLIDENAERPYMPNRLLPPDDETRAEIIAAALAVLAARAQTLAPAANRYDTRNALYAVRCFVRLVPEHPGCPAQLHWSAPTELFRIAPWYAASGRAPLKIALPALDKAALRALKPSVAFEVPDELHALIAGNSPEDFLKGKGGKKSGIGLGWLCSFNIPVITLCAFIVLNIFLGLFDLFLRWLMFVKICIPIPKKDD